MLVYGLIVAACVIENFFPPSPSDVFVVAAAFLSHQGNYEPVAIYATALAGGIGGAIGVYTFARRHARSFGGTRVGRWVLSPSATAFLLKEYGRYGWAGLFLTRLLPGFRSVVAPFAGLAGLKPFAALAPVVLACAVWYGTLTWIGSRVGAEWDGIRRLLSGLNQALAWVAVAAVVAIGGYLWRRRRRRRRST